MSTHSLDVSGARALTMRTNDPASTFAQTPAKQGDDVTVTIGGCREIRLALPPSTRLQVRRYIRKSPRRENGAYVRDPDTNEIVNDETPYEQLVLVVAGSVQAFARVSRLPDDPEEMFEATPHTSVVVRRMIGLHAHESGELLHELVLGEASAWMPPHFPPEAAPKGTVDA